MGKIAYIDISGKRYPMSFSLGASKKLAEKFGGLAKMKEALKKSGGEEKGIDTIIYILSILIAQGCAYKNYFEKDIPAPEDAPIADGKWIPLDAEALELAVGVSDIGEVSKKIEECIGISSKKEVETRTDAKNAKGGQG